MNQARGGRVMLVALALCGLLGCRGPTEPTRGAITFYQRHLGAQWGFHCDFEPSCSEYGDQSIEKFGLVPGILMTGDRLMRDHGLASQQYALAADGHPLDPVENQALFRPLPRPDLTPDWQAVEEGPDPEGTATTWFEFAEMLFHDAEFERARIEYRRILHFYPDSEAAGRSAERLVLCLAEQGFGEAAQSAARSLPPSRSRPLLEAYALRAQGQWEAASREAARPQSRAGRLFAGLLDMEAGRLEGARQHIEPLPDELRNLLRQRLEHFETLPRRSPLLAGSLSALVPGTGQAYAGRWADGLVALLLNGTLIGGTVLAASNDEPVAAGALGLLALGFYTGNVYGGSNAAATFNRDQHEHWMSRTRGLLREGRVGLGLTHLNDGGAVQFYLRF